MTAPAEVFSVEAARAQLHALVAGIRDSEPVTITKRSKPVAVLISIGEARRLYPGKFPSNDEARPSFAEFLMSIPVPFKFQRSRSGRRTVTFVVPEDEKHSQS